MHKLLINLICLGVFISHGNTTFSQSDTLQFKLMWGDKPITNLEDEPVYEEYTISMVKMYVGNISSEDQLGKKSVDSTYHLIDFLDPASTRIPINEAVDSLFCSVGVDRRRNEELHLEGALDPIKGMYWTWNSGYINVKIEASHPSIPSRKNRITLHLGGYLPPNQTHKILTLPLNADKVVNIDLKSFFNSIGPDYNPSIMSPGPEAAALMDHFITSFYVNEK